MTNATIQIKAGYHIDNSKLKTPVILCDRLADLHKNKKATRLISSGSFVNSSLYFNCHPALLLLALLSGNWEPESGQ
jgi:methionine salvage enolase-phosphatase E1